MGRKSIVGICLVVLFLAGCSSSKEVTTPEAVPTSAPVPAEVNQEEKVDDAVSEAEEEDVLDYWMHLNGDDGAYVGIDTKRAYESVLEGKQPQQTVLVAVIDSGVDIEHEDIPVWKNEDEIAGNGIDDDNNGYVDDVHGWNFIGGADGDNVYYDTFEVTREYARLHPIYEDVDASTLSGEEEEAYAYYKEIVAAFDEEVAFMKEIFENINTAVGLLDAANSIMGDFLGGEFTMDQVKAVESDREEINQAKSILLYFDDAGFDKEELIEERETYVSYLEKGLNPEFDPRAIVGDNYSDSSEKIYGNNDVTGPDAFHGTHVAGIIAAKRGNNLGIDGIASSVEIMAVRAVPKGDERDKDIANAIQYAVDNGADIINMSFGKGFSPQKDVVDDAIQYAEANNVLMIHAAGNDGENNDNSRNYPTANLSDSEGKVSTWIEVGASSWEGPQQLAASFSNFGRQNVDVFAPGVDIYSTTPGNEYKHSDGTSMASPVVAGLAALVMAYYPDFSAAEVKDIILDSASSYADLMVTKPGTEGELVAFGILSRTGSIINAYSALKLAEERAKGDSMQ